MFVPTRRDGKLYQASGVNAYGEREFSSRAKLFGYSFVYDRQMLGKTAVRADSSASKARADHIAFDVRILLERKVTPGHGDKIVLGKRVLEVVQVQERVSLSGRLNHWEVDLVAL